jgi:RNA polymerase sigma-70 factor (ECF subfamily)
MGATAMSQDKGAHAELIFRARQGDRAALAELVSLARQGDGAVLAELVSLARQGDRTALGALLSAHSKILLGFIKSQMPTWVDHVVEADDVLADTFHVATRKIATFENRGEGSFRAWLRGIATNLLQNRLEKIARVRPISTMRRESKGADGSIFSAIAALTRTPSEYVYAHEQKDALEKAIDGLPDAERRAFRLHHVDDVSIEETAQTMDRTKGQIRHALRQANLHLRTWLTKKSQRL